MKKLLIVVASLVIGTSAFAKKTGNGTELGGRFIVDQYAQGIGFDMAFAAAKKNRVHADIDLIGNGVAGNCLFEWLIPIPELPELVFYPGIGGGMWVGEGFNTSVVGEVGAEYRFDFPMTLGFDFRPRFDIIDNPGPKAGVGFVIRYRL